jgi:hypothetical protein
MLHVYASIEIGTKDYVQSAGPCQGGEKNKRQIQAENAKIIWSHHDDRREIGSRVCLAHGLPRNFQTWLQDPTALWISEVPHQNEFNFGVTAAIDTSEPKSVGSV